MEISETVFGTIKETSKELNKVIWNTCAVKASVRSLPVSAKEKEEIIQRLCGIEDASELIIKRQRELTSVLDSFYSAKANGG